MIELVLLSPNECGMTLPQQDEVVNSQPAGGGAPFDSVVVALFPHDNGGDPMPLLDRDMKELICACLAPQHQKRPGLATLANVVSKAVEERDAAWYARGEVGHPDPRTESDAFIQKVLRDCIQNAPTT
jgi:hypothetical protein